MRFLSHGKNPSMSSIIIHNGNVPMKIRRTLTSSCSQCASSYAGHDWRCIGSWSCRFLMHAPGQGRVVKESRCMHKVPLMLVAVAAWAHQVGLLERLEQKSGSVLDRHGVVGEKATPVDLDGESFLLSHFNSLPDRYHHVDVRLHVQSNTHLNHVTYILIRICWHDGDP